MFTRALFLFLFSFVSIVSNADTVSYEFDIATKQMNFTGNIVEALAIDDQIPAPTIRAAVGDTLRVTFHNRLDETTSVHWHGVLLPSDQDGVPYLNTQPIASRGSHTFEFPILHSGTFWYHSHTELQIQRGIYGSIVLAENDSEPAIQEEVVLFSDWTDEDVETVLANLKKEDDYYAFKKDAVQSWDKVIANGAAAISNRLYSSFTRMGPMDLADVGYDAFLVNGQRVNSIDVNDPEAGMVKLRMINGSTSSFYDVEYAGGPMTIVAADGQDVEPIRVRRLQFSTAETYDVLVPVTAGQAFELRATSFDGSGYSSLFIGDGARVAAPDIPPPNLFLMDNMNMEMSMGMDMDMATDMDKEMDMNREEDRGIRTQRETSMPDDQKMAMAMTGNVIDHMTNYEYLIATEPTALPGDREWREISLTLSGNMERYVWGFNGRTTSEDPQILIRKGENVRFHLANDTMMNHPLHLHGHFFRVVNQHGNRSPLKHTVNVPPMGKVIIEFAATEEADWLFHCHNQYHMKAGMNRIVSYEETSLFSPAIARQVQPSKRWFRLDEFHLMSSFMDYEFSLANERHEIDFELDADLEDAYEIHLTYNYHFNRFVSAFAGVETREHHHENSHDIGIAGLNVTLPFLIDSEWRVDDHGETRLQLGSELQFTKRFGFDWRWNTDKEHRHGFNYKLSNRWSITVHTDTEYGEGIGIQFYY